MTLVALADVADVNPRVKERPRDADEVAFVPMADLDATKAVTGLGETREFATVSKGYTLFRDRDLLVAKITPCFENNKIGQARLSHPIGVGSSEFHVVRPRSDLVNDRYLLHFLRQGRVRAEGERRMTGSGGQRRVPPGFLKELVLPLPPLEEQRRIAAILDQADTLRAKRRQTLALLDDLTQSIFLEMFTGTSATATVEEVTSPKNGSIRTGPFGSQLRHGEFVDEGIAVLGLDNVVGNEFRWAGRRFITAEKYQQLTRYTVYPGDVLISIMGTTGRCVVVPDDIPVAINTKHICALTLDQARVRPEFVRAAFLWHPDSLRHLRQQTKGSIMDGLNMGIIKAMPLPVPSLEQQRVFASRTHAVRAITQAALGDHLDELFVSLQSRAFRGEL